jgi:pimeloyl-ACP methyl ester carboxylesterase
MPARQHLPGINSIHALFSGPDASTPVLFLHGNLSSSTFWEQTMLSLPSQYRGIAPDLRGFGLSDAKEIDATRGFGDWVEDVLALKTALQITRYHVAGHSLGGGVVFALIAEDAKDIISATLVAPASPYGYGGTKDKKGTPCWPDYAGSGAGGANPTFARLLAAGDRTSSDPISSPRAVMNNYYWSLRFFILTRSLKRTFWIQSWRRTSVQTTIRAIGSAQRTGRGSHQALKAPLTHCPRNT